MEHFLWLGGAQGFAANWRGVLLRLRVLREPLQFSTTATLISRKPRIGFARASVEMLRNSARTLMQPTFVVSPRL